MARRTPKTSEIAQALRTAVQIVDSELPLNAGDARPDPGIMAVRNAVLPVIVRELLDNEYTHDLS